MNETYVECLVASKTPLWAKFLKVLLIAVAVVCVLFSLMGLLIAFIGAILMGVAIYFLNLYTNIEYEYLYLDREFTIDKIMSRTKRKRIGVYKLDRMEVFAPIRSWHLDNYKNRNVKTKDYSIGEELKPDQRYVFYYEGGEKIIVSPSAELVNAMRMVAPRKVFND